MPSVKSRGDERSGRVILPTLLLMSTLVVIPVPYNAAQVARGGPDAEVELGVAWSFVSLLL